MGNIQYQERLAVRAEELDEREEMDPELKRLLVSTLLLGISLYATYKIQQKIMKEMMNPSPKELDKQTHEILRQVGLSEKIISKLKFTSHERALINHLVVNKNDLETMTEVKGLEKAKELINQNLILSLELSRDPSLRELIKLPPGILLYGPPGCGKTMLARAIAREAGFRCLIVDTSILMNKWVGESEKYVKAVFSLGIKVAPIVIFIDEIDMLLSSRNDSSGHYGRLISEFLTAWDGFNKNSSPVVIIGATNRASTLDEAVLRRMPIKIEIPLPNQGARKLIFENELNRDGVSTCCDWEQYIHQTEGWSASKITHFLQAVFKRSIVSKLRKEFEKRDEQKICQGKIEKSERMSEKIENELKIKNENHLKKTSENGSFLSRFFCGRSEEPGTDPDENTPKIIIEEDDFLTTIEEFNNDLNISKHSQNMYC